MGDNMIAFLLVSMFAVLIRDYLETRVIRFFINFLKINNFSVSLLTAVFALLVNIIIFNSKIDVLYVDIIALLFWMYADLQRSKEGSKLINLFHNKIFKSIVGLISFVFMFFMFANMYGVLDPYYIFSLITTVVLVYLIFIMKHKYKIISDGVATYKVSGTNGKGTLNGLK